MGNNLFYALFPVIAVISGAAFALYRRPGEKAMSIIHHFTAGVVFAAAATEILPALKQQSLLAVLLGGSSGVILMMLIQYYGDQISNRAGFIYTIGIDIFIDGLILGISFAAGEKAGLLLTLALTLEILFLGLSVVGDLRELLRSRFRALLAVIGLALLLPTGVFFGAPVAALGTFWLTFFLAFGLVALLYLVTEELLVEAHKGEHDTPFGTGMFFVGFMLLLLLEEGL